VPVLDKFLDMLLSWSVECADDDLQKRSAWRLISSIVNKHADGQTERVSSLFSEGLRQHPTDISLFLNNTLEHFWTLKVADVNTPLTIRQQGIQAWVWVGILFYLFWLLKFIRI
jgi:DNA repair/transcription protein MET18/MMS19